MKAFFAAHKLAFIIGVLLVIIGGAVLFSRGSGQADYELFDVSVRDLTEEVSVTGKVKATQGVDLAFEKGGRIAEVLVAPGEHVERGSVLMRLADGDTYANLLQAEANLDLEEVALADLINGARPEEITISETKVSNAARAVEDAENNIRDKVADAFTRSDDAIRSQVDQIFTNPRSAQPILLIPADTQKKTNLEVRRVEMEKLLVSWEQALLSFGDAEDAVAYLPTAREITNALKTFLIEVSLVVNNLTASASLSQTTIDGYKTDILTARTNVNTAITNLTAAEEKLRTAESALVLAQEERSLVVAPPTAEDVRAQEARVRAAEAQVANYEAQIAKTLIRAPFAGVVTKVEGNPGEIVSVGAVAVSLISDAEYQIELFVPEADIARVSVGNPVVFTLDAYTGDIIFDGQVATIEPGETVLEGVSTYKTTIALEDPDDRVRPGMTANVDIITAVREDVLSVPARAVFFGEEGMYVRVLGDGGSVLERDVVIGIRDVSGFVEVRQGLSAGEQVVVSEE